MVEFVITISAVAFVFMGIQILVEAAENKKRVTSLLVAQAKMSIDALSELSKKSIPKCYYISMGKDEEVRKEFCSRIDSVLEMLYQSVERTCGKSYVKRAYTEINDFDYEIDWVRKIIISKPITSDEKKAFTFED